MSRNRYHTINVSNQSWLLISEWVCVGVWCLFGAPQQDTRHLHQNKDSLRTLLFPAAMLLANGVSKCFIINCRMDKFTFHKHTTYQSDRTFQLEYLKEAAYDKSTTITRK